MSSLKGDLRSWRLLFTLFKLAELGAFSRTVRASTEYLAEKIGTSQQTASRNLIKLETMGWIKRNITPEGCLIKITASGTAALKKVYSDLRLIFEKEYPPYVTLEGDLFTGIGEGAYYITQEKYRKQFIEKMGFDPYPGTLNLKLTTEYDVKTRAELESYPAIELEGFSNGGRTFGPVKCYPAMINNRVKGALVFALRSHYNSSVLEIVAPIFLRSHLKLKDGNKVKVEVITLP